MDKLSHTIDAAARTANALPGEVRAGPPAVVSTLTYLGYGLDVWVQILTIVWLVLLIAGWLWDRFIRPRREAREKANGST